MCITKKEKKNIVNIKYENNSLVFTFYFLTMGLANSINRFDILYPFGGNFTTNASSLYSDSQFTFLSRGFDNASIRGVTATK